MKFAKKTLVLLAIVALIAVALPMSGAFAATPQQPAQTQSVSHYHNGGFCSWYGWNCWNYQPNQNWSNNGANNGGNHWNNWGMGMGCW